MLSSLMWTQTRPTLLLHVWPLENRVATLETDPVTKTYVDTEVAGIVNAAPATLDTLNELAAALGRRSELCHHDHDSDRQRDNCSYQR